MAVVLALPYLFDAVVARFAAEAAAASVAPVPNIFGRRASAQQIATSSRIVWMPGDPNNSLGEYAAPKQPGRDPRPLATLRELFTVELHASDPTKPEDELAQYQAVHELHDAWFRAVYLAARGTVVFGRPERMGGKKERQHGEAWRVVCTIDAMIPDAPYTTATITGAAIATSELDRTETTTTT